MYFSRIIVAELIEALDRGKVIPSIVQRNPHFDWDAGYRAAAEIVRLRRARGEKTIGRKIGFTNRNIWPQYGVDSPIWAPVYDTTLIDSQADSASFSLARTRSALIGSVITTPV